MDRPPVQVGAVARGSVPAAGKAYATDSEKQVLNRYFWRDGCHHCGRRRGESCIGDHMPPNKVANELEEQAKRLPKLLKSPALRWLPRSVGLPLGRPKQRFYPHCEACSQRQSAAVRAGKLVLVWHEVGGCRACLLLPQSTSMQGG